MLYLIAAGIAVSVALLVMAIASLRPPRTRAPRARLVELGLDGPFSKDAAARRSRMRTRVEDLLKLMGESIDSPKRDWGPIRTRLIHAGYRNNSALPFFLGVRIGTAGLLYVYGVLAGVAMGLPGTLSIVFGLVGAAFGWVVPNFVLSSKIENRKKGIQKALPDAVDLLVICVEAGLALNQAFTRVAEELRHLNETLTLELAQMNMEIRAGTPRDQALIAMADRTGVPDLRSLATMLVQTERFGTSIADSLRIHAETMRTKRQQRAEEAAAKTTIKMVFPLAICIFPALFVVVLGPALIGIAQTFASLGG